MKDFLKVFKNIIPYWRYAVLNVVLNIISVFFSLFTLALVVPFLQILFKTQPLVTNLVPFTFSASAITHNFNYYLSTYIVNDGASKALIFVCILVSVMSLLKNFFNYFASFFMAPIINGVVKDFQTKIYNKILALPLGFFSNERKGDIMARFTSDIQEVKFSIMSSLDMVFRDPLTIIIYLASLMYMSPKLTMFVLIFLPVTGLIIGSIGKTLKKESLSGQIRMGELLSILEETLSGLRIIKGFNAEKRMQKKFSIVNIIYYKIINRVTRKRSLSTPVSEFLGTLAVVTIIWYGGGLVLGNESSLSPSEFITYIIIFSQIITPAKSLSTAYYNIQKGMASIDRIGDVLDAEITINDKEDARSITEFKKEIEYRNVSFAYKNDLVLKNINLKIEKGKSVALVGQSGSGKSTIVDILPRFYDIEAGEILIDGVNVKDYYMKSLCGLMGIVSQEAILFNDTYLNNISFGVDHATEKEVIAAAKVANAHEFIVNTEKGYYTNIGDRGSKMSGGQRQRISIARAVLKNPPILILDEATSALDTESERLVQDALFNLMKNRTSIIIAHRLSTIKNVDEICVLHNGEIVERGSHDELLALNGYYNKLYYLQA